MSKNLLIALFSFIFLAMLGTTIYASLDRSVLKVGPQLLGDPWFQATLLDAYLGFLSFYVWVFYKERTLGGKLGWLLAILTLGNMAMSAYAVLQLFRWDPSSGASGLLLRAPQ